MTRDKNIIYAEYSDGTALPADILTPDGHGPFAAVILIHGGGWQSRSRQDMSGVAKALVKAGFAVMNINYRLAPKFNHPSPIDDTTAALNWLIKNSSKYKIDSHKIALWGYSAGAHIASLVGLKNSAVKAVVAGGLPADLNIYPGSSLVIKYLGTTYKKNPQAFAEASPVNYVHAQAPPFYLYHGQWDLLVGVHQMRLFEKALKAKNISVETYVAPLQGHITAFLFSKESIYRGIDFLNKKLTFE